MILQKWFNYLFKNLYLNNFIFFVTLKAVVVDCPNSEHSFQIDLLFEQVKSSDTSSRTSAVSNDGQTEFFQSYTLSAS